jgi:hypothetical protein
MRFILPHWGLPAIECRLAHFQGALDCRRRVRTQLTMVRTDARSTQLRRGRQGASKTAFVTREKGARR